MLVLRQIIALVLTLVLLGTCITFSKYYSDVDPLLTALAYGGYAVAFVGLAVLNLIGPDEPTPSVVARFVRRTILAVSRTGRRLLTFVILVLIVIVTSMFVGISYVTGFSLVCPESPDSATLE